jgi:hypothetical protein
MDGWDLTILIVGGYVAVISLVRLMRTYREKYLTAAHEQAEQERRRKRTQRNPGQHGAAA